MALLKDFFRFSRYIGTLSVIRSISGKCSPSLNYLFRQHCSLIKASSPYNDEGFRTRFYRVDLAVPLLFSVFLYGLDHDNETLFGIVRVNCAEAPRKKLSTERLAAIKALDIVAEVVAEVEPAVVSITSSGSFLNLSTSVGSGFIIDDTGLIITNAHVVGHKQLLRVNIQDGRSFDGKVLAVDVTSDLALVQLQTDARTASKLPKMTLAPSSQVIRSGQFVIALGSPLMLSNTVTVGVVSAVERDLGHRTGLKYIQTDAIITFGNSGGPLVNLYGEVIGVNTMIADTGVGFAVPIDQVQRFIETSKRALTLRASTPPPSNQKASTPKSAWKIGGDNNLSADQQSVIVSSDQQHTRYLGLVMRTLTPELIFELISRDPSSRLELLNVQSGVLIHGVMRGSPAERCGLRPGDIIIEIDRQPISSTLEVFAAVEKKETMSIRLIRRGNILDFSGIHTEPV